jgi:hypothetical protein
MKDARITKPRSGGSLARGVVNTEDRSHLRAKSDISGNRGLGQQEMALTGLDDRPKIRTIREGRRRDGNNFALSRLFGQLHMKQSIDMRPRPRHHPNNLSNFARLDEAVTDLNRR